MSNSQVERDWEKAESSRQASHTPGPWSYFIDLQKRQGHIYGANGFKIHDLFNGTVESQPMVEANAKLIAAAPEMLAALRRALEIRNTSYQVDANKKLDMLDRKRLAAELRDIEACIRLAIVKAEGRSL